MYSDWRLIFQLSKIITYTADRTQVDGEAVSQPAIQVNLPSGTFYLLANWIHPKFSHYLRSICRVKSDNSICPPGTSKSTLSWCVSAIILSFPKRVASSSWNENGALAKSLGVDDAIFWSSYKCRIQVNRWHQCQKDCCWVPHWDAAACWRLPNVN